MPEQWIHFKKHDDSNLNLPGLNCLIPALGYLLRIATIYFSNRMCSMVLMKIQGGKEGTENIFDLNENMNTFYLKLLTNTDKNKTIICGPC